MKGRLMSKIKYILAIVGCFMLATGAQANTSKDIEAGPIWNNGDAHTKCPQVCNMQWNGNWTTTQQGQMSVCGCSLSLVHGQSVDLPAGPIWNNNDAKKKCPTICKTAGWNGNWVTTVQGQMSVCGCTLAPLFPH